MTLLFTVASMTAAAAVLPPYPASRRDDVVETLHGARIADPYRWLEDGRSAEVEQWTAAQSAYTRNVIGALPGRAALEKRLWALHEIGSLSAPVPRPRAAPGGKGGPASTWRYFYTRREGKQNQAVLYVRDGLDNPDRPLVDVNQIGRAHV